MTPPPIDNRPIISKKVLLVTFACIVAIFGLAYFATPHACEWGLTAYFVFGVVAVIGLLTLPFIFERELPVSKRCLHSLAVGFAGLGAWLGAFASSGMPMLCRLF
ncbi:MAG: hypothetical protein H6943_03330 [Zoogloeaceae bacterium]|nr:hypothetical protein [Zoogloeaceae bacterium]